MYQQLNCKEILDSLTYYKQVSRLGNLHGHLRGSMLKINLYTAYTRTCTLSHQMGADWVPSWQVLILYPIGCKTHPKTIKLYPIRYKLKNFHYICGKPRI